MVIDYEELESAIINNSDSSPFTAKAYLGLEDAQIHFVIEDDEFDFHEGEVPEEIADRTKYILLPPINELVNLNELALNFAEQKLPDRFDTLRNFLRSSGGMDKFVKMVDSLRATDDWQDFKKKSYRQSIKNWAKNYQIKFS